MLDRLASLLACVVAVLGLSYEAQAQFVVDYSVDGAGTFTVQGDDADILAFTGSATLDDGVPQILKINTLRFDVFYSLHPEAVLTPCRASSGIRSLAAEIRETTAAVFGEECPYRTVGMTS